MHSRGKLSTDEVRIQFLVPLAKGGRARPIGAFVPRSPEPLVNEIPGTKRDGINTAGTILVDHIMANRFTVVYSHVDAALCKFNQHVGFRAEIFLISAYTPNDVAVGTKIRQVRTV